MGDEKDVSKDILETNPAMVLLVNNTVAGFEEQAMQHLGKMGFQGACVCLGCGYKKVHQPGKPCRDERCPQCGKAMLREGSEHHLAHLKKQEEKRKKT